MGLIRRVEAPALQARKASAQTIATGAFTAVLLDTVVWQRGSFFEFIPSPNAATPGFIVPRTTCLLRVHGQVNWATSATGYRQAGILRAGTIVSDVVSPPDAAVGIAQVVFIEDVWPAGVGVVLGGAQNSGGNLDIVVPSVRSPRLTVTLVDY